MTTEELIKAHCDKHERSGRAQFSVAGIRALLDRIASLEAALAEAQERVLAVYDECAGVAVPARSRSFGQVEAYRSTILALKARAAALSSSKQKDGDAPTNTVEKP